MKEKDEVEVVVKRKLYEVHYKRERPIRCTRGSLRNCSGSHGQRPSID